MLCGVAVVFALVAVSVTGLHSAHAQAKAGKAVLGPWGVELTAMDKAIAPGDDFFRYAGGTWMKTTQIPADRARWGAFSILGAKSEDDVRAALDEAAKAGVTAVIQPGGSVKDEDVIKAADEHGIAMIFTKMRHFRH